MQVDDVFLMVGRQFPCSNRVAVPLQPHHEHPLTRRLAGKVQPIIGAGVTKQAH